MNKNVKNFIKGILVILPAFFCLLIFWTLVALAKRNVITLTIFEQFIFSIGLFCFSMVYCFRQIIVGLDIEKRKSRITEIINRTKNSRGNLFENLILFVLVLVVLLIEIIEAKPITIISIAIYLGIPFFLIMEHICRKDLIVMYRYFVPILCAFCFVYILVCSFHINYQTHFFFDLRILIASELIVVLALIIYIMAYVRNKPKLVAWSEFYKEYAKADAASLQ